MLKRCFKCGEEKPFSEFYKHPQMADGHLGKCKECTKKDVAARVGILSKDPVWSEKERERCRIKTAAYHKIHGAPKNHNAHSKKWCAANKEKRRAHHIARRALLNSEIKKPELCDVCHTGKAEEMHHADYSKPLEVTWMCTKCHAATRRKSGPIHK